MATPLSFKDWLLNKEKVYDDLTEEQQINWSVPYDKYLLGISAQGAEPLAAAVKAFAEHLDKRLTPLENILVQSAVSEACSTASQREYNQTRFKEQMRVFYGCINPSNTNVTKCMVLNHFFQTKDVTASHIIALEKAQALTFVGRSINDKYNVKNGLLLYSPIDKAFEALDIAFILDTSGNFVLKVLYDDLYDKEVALISKTGRSPPAMQVNRSTVGVSGGGKLKWSDLHNTILVLPITGNAPYRSCLLWLARRAFDQANSSARPHEVAKESTPTAEQWIQMGEMAKKSGSPEHLVMHTWLNEVNEVV